MVENLVERGDVDTADVVHVQLVCCHLMSHSGVFFTPPHHVIPRHATPRYVISCRTTRAHTRAHTHTQTHTHTHTHTHTQTHTHTHTNTACFWCRSSRDLRRCCTRLYRSNNEPFSTSTYCRSCLIAVLCCWFVAVSCCCLVAVL